ncbi:hypothetical protein Ancab_027911 [Ancistrocladus abbreviatus]
MPTMHKGDSYGETYSLERETLAAYAQNYAKKRRGDCNMWGKSGGPYRENIAGGYGAFSIPEAVSQWVNEKNNYNHALNKCVKGRCVSTILRWFGTILFILDALVISVVLDGHSSFAAMTLLAIFKANVHINHLSFSAFKLIRSLLRPYIWTTRMMG